MGAALNTLGALAAEEEPERAREMLERALALHREVGARSGEAESLTALGRLEERGGHPEVAAERYGEAVAAAEAVEEPGPGVLAGCLLAGVDPSRYDDAWARLEASEVVLEAFRRMEAHFALWRSKKTDLHLDEAIRILNHMAEDLTDEEVERLLAKNPVCRALRTAAAE